ncbi:hypothetical protein FACS189459_5320 [Bacilli bacterium]|nr:hypothetical protein FACS189459_5320 [Bacilli bacterium]GHU51763.1 hypothetical protein FACS189496_0720 [Bacilli bacterium]
MIHLFILLIKSSSPFAKQNIAIVSLATVISKLDLYLIFFFSLMVISTCLKERSLTSNERFHKIFSWLIFNSFPQYIELSIQAAIRLFNEVIACISPVK